MKIYVLIEYDNAAQMSAGYPLGAFSSLDKAKQRLMLMANKAGVQIDLTHSVIKIGYNLYYIKDFTLDN